MNDKVETANRYQLTEWLWWVLATTAGWVLGSLATYAISIVMSLAGIGGTAGADLTQMSQSTALLFMAVSLVAFFIMGAAVGAVQWLVLRRYVPGINRWAIFTGLGLAVGMFIQWTFVGLGVGMMQWMLLRRELNKTQWWLVANAVAWPLGYLFGSVASSALSTALGSVFLGGLVGSVLIGAIIGAVTGLLLLWLLYVNRELLDGLRQEAAGAKS